MHISKVEKLLLRNSLQTADGRRKNHSKKILPFQRLKADSVAHGRGGGGGPSAAWLEAAHTHKIALMTFKMLGTPSLR